MNKKIVLIIALLSIFMIGCTKEEKSTLVQDGRAALEAHEYSDAMKILSEALEENKDDEHARAMYMQAMRMLNVDKFKSYTNYKKAIEELEAIENIKNGSSVIKDEASSELKEMKKLYEEQLTAQAERKESAKITASKDVYNANQELIKAEQAAQKAEEEAKKAEEEEAKKAEEEANKEENNTNNIGTDNINNPQGSSNQSTNITDAPET